MEESEKSKLPMKWWHFWEWFRLPVGLFFSIYTLSTYIIVFDQFKQRSYVDNLGIYRTVGRS